ncbi:MAG: ArsA family ATPase [Actinomycetota bacterium]
MVPSPSTATTVAKLVDTRLLIVSGKGGVGKTTVAAGIAVAAARTGKRVLLVEVEQREGLAPLFGKEHLGYKERPLARNIIGLSVVPDEALMEYLYLFYGIGRIARPLLTGRAVDFATNTAPGLRDILLIGKVKEAENRRTGGSFAFDLIVLDAPPTGRLPRFLDAPRAVVELVKSGAIQQQAQGVVDMLEDEKRTRVVLVTLAEEMPVRETIEAAGHLRELHIAVGPVIVNKLQEQPFSPDQRKKLAAAGPKTLLDEANVAGITLTPEQAGDIATIANAQARRADAQQHALEGLKPLDALGRYTLPALPTAEVRLREVERLADALQEQGAV